MSDTLKNPNRDEAALWFAALHRGVMTVEERRDYEAWRSQPSNAAAMAEMETVWNRLGIAQAEFGANKAAVSSPRRIRKANPALVAAMCAVSLGIGILSYSGENTFWTTLDWTAR